MDEALGQSTESAPTQAPVSTPSESAPSERTFRQSEVNELVGRVRQEESQKRERLYKEQPQYAEQKYGQSNQSYQQPQHSNAMPESDIRRMASEEAQRLRDQWVNDAQSKNEQDNAQRIVKSFWDKTASGKEKYDDFEKVTGNIELSKFPNVVQLLAEHVDNSADLLYDFGKNRLKMAQLEQLSYLSPSDAIHEVKRIAESIKANETAGKMRTPNAPLSQQRPSNIGTDAGGVLSMRDLKAKYKG